MPWSWDFACLYDRQCFSWEPWNFQNFSLCSKHRVRLSHFNNFQRGLLSNFISIPLYHSLEFTHDHEWSSFTLLT